ncbi:hypothetical protein IIY24_02735 [Candidatus Saccharibacteria bacterium]|nr:hypothetical protein [Candidatus Saccharibacteria bacterium]
MKNLRVLLGIVLALSLVLITGCAQGNSTAVEEEPVPVETEESSETIPEEPVEEAPEEEVVEEVLETPEQSPPEDELAMFFTTEEGVRSTGGCICLVRDGTMYSITGVPINGSTNPATYSAGTSDTLIDNGVYQCFYATLDKDRGKGFWCISIGDVVVPVISRDDMIIGYASDHVPTLELYDVEFHSYGLCVHQSQVPSELGGGSTTTGWRIYTGVTPGDYVEFTRDEIGRVCVCDLDGNQASDGFGGLEYNETYLLTWYEGTQYYEIEVVANSAWYNCERMGSKYDLEGELTREGYAVYDFSDVSPGVYWIRGGDVVVIE